MRVKSLHAIVRQRSSICDLWGNEGRSPERPVSPPGNPGSGKTEDKFPFHLPRFESPVRFGGLDPGEALRDYRFDAFLRQKTGQN